MDRADDRSGDGIKRTWPLPGPDSDDLVFLALARSAGAVLVSGDLADYPEAIRNGVSVLSPKDYWASLQQD